MYRYTTTSCNKVNDPSCNHQSWIPFVKTLVIYIYYTYIKSCFISLTFASLCFIIITMQSLPTLPCTQLFHHANLTLAWTVQSALNPKVVLVISVSVQWVISGPIAIWEVRHETSTFVLFFSFSIYLWALFIVGIYMVSCYFILVNVM